MDDRAVPPAPAEDTVAILNRTVDALDDDTPAAEDVRTAYRALAGEDLGAGDWPAALHAALSRNEIVFRLNEELEIPKALESLPPALAAGVGRAVTEAEILA